MRELDFLLLINAVTIIGAAVFISIYAVREMRKINEMLNRRLAELISLRESLEHEDKVKECQDNNIERR